MFLIIVLLIISMISSPAMAIEENFFFFETLKGKNDNIEKIIKRKLLIPGKDVRLADADFGELNFVTQAWNKSNKGFIFTKDFSSTAIKYHSSGIMSSNLFYYNIGNDKTINISRSKGLELYWNNIQWADNSNEIIFNEFYSLHDTARKNEDGTYIYNLSKNTYNKYDKELIWKYPNTNIQSYKDYELLSPDNNSVLHWTVYHDSTLLFMKDIKNKTTTSFSKTNLEIFNLAWHPENKGIFLSVWNRKNNSSSISNMSGIFYVPNNQNERILLGFANYPDSDAPPVPYNFKFSPQKKFLWTGWNNIVISLLNLNKVYEDDHGDVYSDICWSSQDNCFVSKDINRLHIVTITESPGSCSVQKIIINTSYMVNKFQWFNDKDNNKVIFSCDEGLYILEFDVYNITKLQHLSDVQVLDFSLSSDNKKVVYETEQGIELVQFE
ncbi:hypothetical protein HZA55_09935 [Candidatus Poribacteria bacterium]|nr:hypothetical protein [Candidatus Poribacteria bacterium]